MDPATNDATPPAATNDAPPAPSPATTPQLEGARRRLITAHGQRVSLELAPTSVAIARTGAFALIGCTDGSIRLCTFTSKLPPANLGAARPRGEKAEAKRERKQAALEQKQERRERKRETKRAFAAERSKQLVDMQRTKQLPGGTNLSA